MKEELAEAKKIALELEENQKNMTKIMSPSQFSPSSLNNEAVIQFQKKNFKEMSLKLEEVSVLLCNLGICYAYSY